MSEEPEEPLDWVVLEYLKPTAPNNRRVFEPVEGFGPVVFRALKAEAREYFEQLGGAPGDFRVVPVDYAAKVGLLEAPP